MDCESKDVGAVPTDLPIYLINNGTYVRQCHERHLEEEPDSDKVLGRFACMEEATEFWHKYRKQRFTEDWQSGNASDC